jgi:NADH dehydrogenase
VVIIGGGFGGLSAAQHLGHKPVDITLIDRNNYHLFQPLLYQVATGGLSPADIASPLRSVLSRYQNIRILMDEVIEIFPAESAILTRNRMIDYDYLILAAGSENHYFGNDHWAECAPGLKTVEDALQIRNRVFRAFEEAEGTANQSIREALMTFAVVGGGPTGVEMAGALAELAFHTLRNDFRNIDPLQSKIYLIEGGSRVLPGYSERLSRSTVKSLERLGVQILTDSMVKTVSDDKVVIHLSSGGIREIGTRNIIWAAGNNSNPLARSLSISSGVPIDRSGKLQVNPDLTAGEFSNIYAIGDLAAVTDPSGKSLPGTAPVAMQQGEYAAQSILKSVRGQSSRPFVFRDRGMMVVIGRNAAAVDFGRFGLSGPVAWFLWAVVHIMNLVEFDNRLIVMIQWAWDYFTRNKGARLVGKGHRREVSKEIGLQDPLKKSA